MAGINTDFLSYYERWTKTGNPRRWAVLIDDYMSILTKPISLVCGVWDRRDVFSFQHALITAIAHWKRTAAESGACPISCMNLEVKLHETEMELLEGLGKTMHQLQDENMIPLGEMVRPEHYEQAKDMSKQRT
ncbi:Phosphotransferase enzyme [Sticta canariensis]|nr:Phosphotransferase enzyme [Sticta canariensis]